MLIKLLQASVFISLMLSGILYAASIDNHMILLVDRDRITKSNLKGVIEGQTKIIFDKSSIYWGGAIYRNYYYVFEKKHRIFRYNLQNGNNNFILDLEGAIKESLTLREILYVDTDKIFFSATKPISSAQGIYKSFFFVVNLKTIQVSQLPIYDNVDGNLSIYKNKFYYTRNDGMICVYNGANVESTGIIGRYPTIAPNGLKLAYKTSSNLFEVVKIYCLNSRKTKNAIRFFGESTVNPIIKWSSDSRLIAVHKRSDLTPKPLYIIDTEEGKTIYKIKKNVAENWFFKDPGEGQ